MTPVIEARGVSRRYGERAVLDGVSLAIAPGEWVSLVGPSGCGKTTLLQILGLLDRPTSGQVVIRDDPGESLETDDPGESLETDDDCWSHPDAWRARARLGRIGFVFQDGNLLGHLTARENVAFPAWRHRGSRKQGFARADELLAKLDLAAHARTLGRVLSTGEAQRVAIARALANEPAIVLADEPTGSLDSGSAERVLAALAEITAAGAALLVVTHDRDIARRASRIVVMRDGRISEQNCRATT